METFRHQAMVRPSFSATSRFEPTPQTTYVVFRPSIRISLPLSIPMFHHLFLKFVANRNPLHPSQGLSKCVKLTAINLDAAIPSQAFNPAKTRNYASTSGGQMVPSDKP